MITIDNYNGIRLTMSIEDAVKLNERLSRAIGTFAMDKMSLTATALSAIEVPATINQKGREGTLHTSFEILIKNKFDYESPSDPG